MASRLLISLGVVLFFVVGSVTAGPAGSPDPRLEVVAELDPTIPRVPQMDEFTAMEIKRTIEKSKSVPRVSDPEASHHGIPNDVVDDYFVPSGTFDTTETDVPGEPLTPEDFDTALNIVQDSIDISRDADPIELAGAFQGDILLLSSDDFMSKGGSPGATQRNAVIESRRLWVNGVVPYVISNKFTKTERAIVASAIREYHSNTCLRFKPRTNEIDYIHILKGDGCSSHVGHIGGAQPVSLGPGCVYKGIIMHEFMHAAGFWHEQSREDRDNYISIVWSNIQTGMESNFKKYDWTTIQSLGVMYDPGSVMHYGSYAFATDRTRPTIIPKHDGVEIGQRRGFSDKDKTKLNLLYNCTQKPVITTTTTSKPPDDCVDNHVSCEPWAKKDECIKNPSWMKKNCRKSCGECEKPCEDLNTYCGAWAKRGECLKNELYMTLFCEKACGLCVAPGGNGSCEDKNKYCGDWVVTGQCYINPDYMHKHCVKSCGLCR